MQSIALLRSQPVVRLMLESRMHILKLLNQVLLAAFKVAALCIQVSTAFTQFCCISTVILLFFCTFAFLQHFQISTIFFSNLYSPLANQQLFSCWLPTPEEDHLPSLTRLFHHEKCEPQALSLWASATVGARRHPYLFRGAQCKLPQLARPEF